MQPDPQPGRYYVTAIDGPKRYFLAGPWETHAEALAQVAAVRRFAELVRWPTTKLKPSWYG